MYRCEELEKIIDAPNPSVQEKLRLLLRYLARISAHPGQRISFDAAHDYSVLCAKNGQEAVFYLQSLEGQNLVAVQSTLNTEDSTLTADGWQSVEEMERAGDDSPYAFIAMWFDSSQDEARKVIHAAIQASGYSSIRIDEVEHVNRIDDEIIARIRQSKFLVADLTGQRNGVYFEAGFMLGLGRPVVWLCKDSEADKVHFDTRQYNMILYSDPQELQKKLQFRIQALLGKGPDSRENSE